MKPVKNGHSAHPHTRMKSTSLLRGISTLSHPSTAEHRLFPRLHFSPNIPPARSHEPRETTGNYLSAAEVVIPGRRPTPIRSSGRMFIKGMRISIDLSKGSEARQKPPENGKETFLMKMMLGLMYTFPDLHMHIVQTKFDVGCWK